MRVDGAAAPRGQEARERPCARRRRRDRAGRGAPQRRAQAAEARGRAGGRGAASTGSRRGSGCAPTSSARRSGARGWSTRSRSTSTYYEGRADGLLASARWTARRGALARFEGEGQELTPAGARAVVARRHGFETWSALKRHVVALDEDGDPFRRAYLAVESGADGTLRQLLERFPELARANGTNGNALINMADRRSASCGRCSTPAPTSRTPTRTAGRRCTRRPTATTRALAELLLSLRTRPPTSAAAARAARRWSSRCSGATTRSSTCC